MNVIVSNKYQSLLASLNIDVIKSINGEFSVDDLIAQFSTFYYNKMILDITAIKGYEDINVMQNLSVNFDMSKVILLLDDSEKVNSPMYISQLISMGIYNFTNDVNTIKYLIDNPNQYKDVANYPEIFTELTDSGIDFSQFSGGKLADSTVDGKHYGIPFDNGATIMAIRSDMVEKAGLTVEDFKDTTWSEFMELAKKVVDANGVPMLTSSGGSEIVIEMLQSAGASPMQDGEVKLVDNAALKKAIEVYKQLIDEGIMVDYTDWDQYIASMNKGEAAGVRKQVV